MNISGLRIRQDGLLWLKAYFTQLKLLAIEKDLHYALLFVCLSATSQVTAPAVGKECWGQNFSIF
jgi:hypothetical protein